jgi:predicted transcriptional regulator
MKTTSLGPLERKVMQCLWGHQETSVREIHECLQKRKKIAYTTVMTILDRLHTKGLVKRKKAGKAYSYTPLLSKREIVQHTINKTLKSLSSRYGTEASAAFANGIQELPRKEREKILKFLHEDEER